MSRVQSFALSVGVVVLLSAPLAGSPFILVLLTVVSALALVVGRSAVGRGREDLRWSTSTGGIATTTASTAGGGALATIRSLGRVEGRLLFWSQWFTVGIGLCAVNVLAFAVLWVEDSNEAWQLWVQTTPWFVHPLAGMTVFASHRAATRARRDATDELVDTCPVRPETRALGLMAAAWLPVLTIAVFLAGFAAILAWRAPGMHGSLGADSVGDLLGTLLLGVGAVALGTALGQWVRFGLAPVVAVVAIGFASIGLNAFGGHGWNPYVQLSTAPTIEVPSPVFADRPVWAHALWIAALSGIVVVAAVLRHRRDRPLLLGGVGVVLVAGAAAFAATAEMPRSSAIRIADLVVHPELHQECVDISDRVSVCMFPLHGANLAKIRADAAAVAAALPPQVGPIVIRQVYDNSIEQLPPEVRRFLPDSLPERPDNEVAFDGFDTVGTFSGPRRDIAQAAVGLPSEPDDDLMPTIISGQARGVVALWLSVRGLDIDDQLRRTTIPEPPGSDPFERGSLDGVGVCSVPSVVWSGQDLAAARSLIALDDDMVAAAIEADWPRWIDPTTGTDVFLAAVGLPAHGPYDVVEPRRGEPC